MQAFKLFIAWSFFMAPIFLSAQTRDSLLISKKLDSLYLQARNLNQKRQYDQALAVCDTAGRIVVENFGMESAAYGNYCFALGSILQLKDDLPNAARRLLEAKRLLGTHLGTVNLSYARCVNNLAILYKNQSKYEQAEPLYLESLAIRAQLIGRETRDYAMALNNIGNYYYACGDYANAEKYHADALDIREKILPEDDPDYKQSLNNLANVYSDLGNYAAAEKLYLQNKISEEKNQENQPQDYAQTLNNLGNLYRRMGAYDKAEPLYLESKSIRERILKKNSYDYIQILNNLGILYKNSGRLEKAGEMFVEAQSILKTDGKQDHPQYIMALHNLGNVFRYIGKDSLAITYYQEALEICERVLGRNHPVYADIIRSRANLHLATGRYPELEADLGYLEQYRTEAIRQAKQFLSATELSMYLERLIETQSLIFSYAWISRKRENAIGCYDHLLRTKGLLLYADAALRALAGTNPEIAEKYRNLKVFGRQLAAQYALPLGRRDSARINELEFESNRLEKDLARSLTGFDDRSDRVRTEQVYAALKPGEAAIELTAFENSNSGDSVQYVALALIPGDSIPYFIPLFKEKQLATLLNKTGDDARQVANLYAAGRSGELLDAAPAYGPALYNLIWRPLDSLLQAHKIKTVYFSPAGLLHRVAFAALPAGKNKVLSDRYTLRQLGSTRSLALRTSSPVAQDYAAAVFGGVIYDRDTNLPPDSSSAALPDNRLWRFMAHPGSNRVDRFNYLPGALQETRRIEQIFARHGVRAQTYTGNQATEEMLKALGQDAVRSPDILHIATHGFFFPDPGKNQGADFSKEPAFKWNENPLLRSGLALAGANAAWSGTSGPGHLEDGIATAYEISKMNLSNTKLAVLSACQTGLGDIDGSEGVYGLQRAFKMAGADHLLVSLWQVPDQETADFMEAFYSAWLGGKPIQEAFAKAQKKMRKKYKAVDKWGAWVFIE